MPVLKVYDGATWQAVGGVESPLTVEELDGSPSGQPGTLKFPNGTVTDNGDGSFTVASGNDPTTTKGDLIVHGAATERLAVGTDGQVLVADSAQEAGIRWGMNQPAVQGATAPTQAEGDLVYRHARAVTTLGIGFIGDSITVNGSPQAGTIAATDLSINGLTVSATVEGVGGTLSADWQPGGGDYLAATGAFAAAGVRIVSIMLGTNDAKMVGQVATSTYRTNMANIANDLVAKGYLVVLNAPIYIDYTNPSASPTWDASADTMAQGYATQLMSIANGRTIFMGDVSGFDFFKNRIPELSDGVHPTQTGFTDLGRLWAAALSPVVSAITGEQVDQRLALGATGKVLVAGASAPAWGAALKSLGVQTVGATQVAVAHGLSYTPTVCLVMPTSAGQIWRSAASDATNVYLTADAAGRTGEIYVG